MESDERVLELRSVTIAYGGHRIVSAIDFELRRGEVVALLGRNGSGKSSLIRCLLGQQRPEGGEIRLLGAHPVRRRIRLMRRVGYVPEVPQLPPELSRRRLASLGEACHGDWDRHRFESRLDRFGVPPSTPFGRLSKGQKKQVELAWALARNPRLLILDDPTLGLDTVARRSLYEELADELGEDERSVLLTTHDLREVEGFADRVAILRGGHLVVDEPVESLKARFRKLVALGDRESRCEPSSAFATWQRSWGTEWIVDDWGEERAGSVGSGLEVRTMSLEDIFAAFEASDEEVAA